MRSKSLSSEHGYALIEVIVSLLVMSIIVSVVYNSYLFVSKAVVTWQRNMILQNDLHLITQRLSEDLTYAEQLFFDNDTTWTIVEASDQTIHYTYHDCTLSRNSIRMHHPDVQITRFYLLPSTDQTEFDPLRLDPQGEDEQSLMQVTFRLDLEGWDLPLTNTTTVALRLHRPWPPLAKALG